MDIDSPNREDTLRSGSIPNNTIWLSTGTGDISMSVKLTVSIGLLVLLLSASDAFGFSSGGRSRREGGVSSGAQGSTGGGSQASVPEPSTLYAVGTALALLGGAGWYIRRRK